MDALNILPFETSKNDIPQPALAKQSVIPKFASSVYMVGSSASGKTTLLLNLLLKPQFYGGYFDELYLFSKTGGLDSLSKQLKIPKKNINTEFDQKKLRDIMNKQERDIKRMGEAKSKKIAIIFDDVIQDQKFLKSPICKEMAILARHFNIMTFFLSQSFNQIPRPIRLSFNCIYVFAGSQSERKIIASEYCPPGWTEREVLEAMDTAYEDRYDFLQINNALPKGQRLRKNLTHDLSKV